MKAFEKGKHLKSSLSLHNEDSGRVTCPGWTWMTKKFPR
jgi:hypothetical protein